MYIARYDYGPAELVQAIVHLPGAASSDTAAPSLVNRLSRQRALYASNQSQLDLAVRVSCSNGQISRLLAMTASAKHEPLLRRCVGMFTRLESVDKTAVDVPLARESHDARLGEFPPLRCYVDASGYSARGRWFASPFRLFPHLLNMLSEANELGYNLTYQANIRRVSPSPDHIREARVNLLRLQGIGSVPASVLQSQEEVISSLPEMIALVDEYVGTDSDEAVGWLSSAIQTRFVQTPGVRSFTPPRFAFDCDMYDEMLTSAANTSLFDKPTAERFCSAGLTRAQLDILVSIMGLGPPGDEAGAASLDEDLARLRRADIRSVGGPPVGRTDTLPVFPGLDDFAFISYKREDFGRVAKALSHAAASGYRLWYDAGIPGGAVWDEELERRIAASSIVIALLSTAAVDSKYVRRELKYADVVNRPILPVLLEPVVLGKGLGLLLHENEMLSVRSPGFTGSLLDALRSFGLQQH